jgi:hypothetical protein
MAMSTRRNSRPIEITGQIVQDFITAQPIRAPVNEDMLRQLREAVERQINAGADEMIVPIVVEDKTVWFIGKVGTGKSTIFGCALGRKTEHGNEWKDKTTQNKFVQVQIRNSVYRMFDSIGFRGTWKVDVKLLRKFVNMRQNNQPVNIVFLCFSATRFTEAEENIISMLDHFTTSEFRSFIRVMITHYKVPEDVDVFNRFKEDVYAKLRPIIGPEGIEDKVFFTDLIDPFRFDAIEGRQVIREWVDEQIRLHQTIATARDSFEVKDVMKHNVVVEFIKIYFTEIIIFLSVVIIMILAWMVYDEQLRSMDLLKESIAKSETIAQLNETLKNITTHKPAKRFYLF